MPKSKQSSDSDSSSAAPSPRKAVAGRGEDSGAEDDDSAVRMLSREERQLLWEEIIVMERRRRDTETKLEVLGHKEKLFQAEEERMAAYQARVEERRKRAEQDRAEQVARIATEPAPADPARILHRELPRDSDGRGPRGRLRLDQTAAAGQRRLLGGLKGILGAAKKDLESSSAQSLQRKREEAQERCDKRLSERTQEMRQEQREQLQTNRRQYEQLIAKLDARVDSLRSEWIRMTAEEAAMQAAHFLSTGKGAGHPVLWVPAVHTQKTREQLAERRGKQAKQYREWRQSFDKLLNTIRESGISRRDTVLGEGDSPPRAARGAPTGETGEAAAGGRPAGSPPRRGRSEERSPKRKRT
eukprot:TRINITY_DN10492_c0_g2_i1.p2 TRINITY_DN10492_c0_g2~~TRINITY_DN10492_c0_g2_i1.p2  ORF type:complete len:381 (+),score=131.22 TRINITY_DN10492_c0_g2_i1:74-1144(+)